MSQIQNRNHQAHDQNRIRIMVFMGLFLALEIILTRFLSIQTPIVRIGFTFLPIALSAMMFGPWISGVTAALADVLGMMLFSSGMPFFPGFTASAFLTGVIYGIFLYKKQKNLKNISLAVLLVSVVITLGLDTLWLWMLTGDGILVLLPARVLKFIVMIPIQILMIQTVWRHVLQRGVSSVF